VDWELILLLLQDWVSSYGLTAINLNLDRYNGSMVEYFKTHVCTQQAYIGDGDRIGYDG